MGYGILEKVSIFFVTNLKPGLALQYNIDNTFTQSKSTGCEELRSIVLLNLRRVSDVGIRYLASCRHLEALNGKSCC